MNPLGIITLSAFGIFTLFILNKKEKYASDYLLILVNLTLSFTVLFDYDFVIHEIRGYKLFLHFNTPFWLISAFLLYAFSLLKGKFVLKWWFFVFSLPFSLYSAYDLILNPNQSTDSLLTSLVDPNWVYHLFFKPHKIFILVVGIVIITNIRRHNSAIKTSFSYTERISLHWLRNFTYWVVGIFTIQLVTFLLYNLGVITEIGTIYFGIQVLVLLSAIYLSFYGIQQYNYPRDANPSSEPVPVALPTEEPKSEENEIIFKQVTALFEGEQTYTDPKLRIGGIAEKLSIPTHKLSQAINKEFGKPFYDLVASYRVASLKEKLEDPGNAAFTILALAMDAGFNSKASLNRIFKEHTGMTPSQYQKAHFAR